MVTKNVGTVSVVDTLDLEQLRKDMFAQSSPPADWFQMDGGDEEDNAEYVARTRSSVATGVSDRHNPRGKYLRAGHVRSSQGAVRTAG